MRAWIHRIRTWVLLLLRSHLTPRGIGVAVGLGVFIGVLPIYGLHILACVVIARRWKLNQPLMYAAANISNPLFAPFLIGLEVAIGQWIRFGEYQGIAKVEMHGAFWEIAEQAGDLLISCLVGSLPLGLVLGGGLGWGTYAVALRWQNRRKSLEGPPVEGAHGEDDDGEPPSEAPQGAGYYAARVQG